MAEKTFQINYGKGVSKVEALLKKQGKDASIKLYSGARHEILNDFTYDEVLGIINVEVNKK